MIRNIMINYQSRSQGTLIADFNPWIEDIPNPGSTLIANENPVGQRSYITFAKNCIRNHLVIKTQDCHLHTRCNIYVASDNSIDFTVMHSSDIVKQHTADLCSKANLDIITEYRII